jgi:hypothetical protein
VRPWISALLAVGSLWCPSARANGLVAHIPRASSPPRLDDAAMPGVTLAGTKATDFRQWLPGDGQPISTPTAAYLSYDDRNLYVVFICKQEPGKVRSRLARRDEIAEDDRVGIALDTFHDRRRFYRFSSNALGVQQDAISTEGQDDDLSFDTVWHSEGRLTAEGYVVLMAIPFKSLRFSHSLEQHWGLALYRSVVHKNEFSYWPHISRKVEGFAQQFATLEGIEAVSPPRNWQLMPYAFLGYNQFLPMRGDLPVTLLGTAERRAGADFKAVFRNALTLDVALNPDFSQVESDEPQLTVNKRYEVLFPEKRPFFIENAGFFQTPENLFFSRRIIDPQLGTRLTGKLGSWALGGLFAVDSGPGAVLSQRDPLYRQNALIGVARVAREFGRQSHIGVLANGVEFGPNTNRLISVDARMKWTDNWVAVGQAAFSQTRIGGGRTLSGTAYLADVSRSGLHFSYSGRYNDRSPEFQAQLGFIPRVNLRQTTQTFDYRWYPEGAPVKTIELWVNGTGAWDYHNRLQDLAASAALQVEFAGRTYITVTQEDAFERYLEQDFRKRRVEAALFADRLKWMLLSVSGSAGTNINYYPAGGTPVLGNQKDARVDFTLRPHSRLRLRPLWLYSRLDTRDGSGRTIFENHIFRTHVNYQFSRRLALRFILNYTANDPSRSLAAIENTRRLDSDILLSYQLHPGTAVFIGYGDQRESLVRSPGMGPPLYPTGYPGTVIGRQFFLKLSYLLRM